MNCNISISETNNDKPDYMVRLENEFRKLFFIKLQLFLFNERNIKEFDIRIESISLFCDESDLLFNGSNKPKRIREPLSMKFELVVFYTSNNIIDYDNYANSESFSYIDYVLDSRDDYVYTLRSIESNFGTKVIEHGKRKGKLFDNNYNLPPFPIHFIDLYDKKEVLQLKLS